VGVLGDLGVLDAKASERENEVLRAFGATALGYPPSVLDGDLGDGAS
jgi:hypothetical protein